MFQKDSFKKEDEFIKVGSKIFNESFKYLIYNFWNLTWLDWLLLSWVKLCWLISWWNVGAQEQLIEMMIDQNNCSLYQLIDKNGIKQIDHQRSSEQNVNCQWMLGWCLSDRPLPAAMPGYNVSRWGRCAGLLTNQKPTLRVNVVTIFFARFLTNNLFYNRFDNRGGGGVVSCPLLCFIIEKTKRSNTVFWLARRSVTKTTPSIAWQGH